MEKDNKNDGVLDIFRKEFEKVENFKNLLEKGNSSQQDYKEALIKLLADYESLLRDTVKITRIGDVSQHKLLKAKEKIEDLNDKLVESERNVRELNTILMFYIKATDK